MIFVLKLLKVVGSINNGQFAEVHKHSHPQNVNHSRHVWHGKMDTHQINLNEAHLLQ